MSHSGNEMLKEDAFEEVKQQYIDEGHTEKQASSAITSGSLCVPAEILHSYSSSNLINFSFNSFSSLIL